MKALTLLFALFLISTPSNDKEVINIDDNKTITIVYEGTKLTLLDVVIEDNNTTIYLK